MSITFTPPEGFHYVGAALLSTVFVLAGQNVLVSRWRRRSGIKYPQLYAEKSEAVASKDAMMFNCAQRAHQNTLENIPAIYLTTVLTGLKHPIFAAATCAIWSVSRIGYTRGYMTGDPAKRLNLIGKLGYSGLVLLASSTYIVGRLIISNL